MKPILFNTEMVRAILEGRKTVTRRVAFPDKDLRPFRESNWWFRGRVYPTWDNATRSVQGVLSLCKYRPGDILYVRETWYKDAGRYMYKANYSDTERFYRAGKEVKLRWNPSIHMPKETARIFLRVTGVRVERLQDIDEPGAVREGCSPGCSIITGGPWGVEDDPDEWSARKAFEELWDSTIKPSDRDKYGWAANPWVWVVEFEKIGKDEINELH